MSKTEVVGRFVEALQAASDRVELPEHEPVVALASRFGVGGLIARHSGVAVDRGLHLARCLRDRLLLESAQEISRILDANCVRHCFARGIALLGAEYEPGEREMADLDLYVPSDEVSAARAALDSLGYAELPIAEQGGPAALRSNVDLERHGSNVQSVAVDLHWAVEPVTWLLPRPGHALPDPFWQRVDRTNALPRPSVEHHVALLVHHLVHHDLLHLRGVLDLALVLDANDAIDGTVVEDVAKRWEVLRATRLLHEAIVSNLGVGAVRGIAPAPDDWRARPLANRLRLTDWIVWAASGREDEHTTVNPRRIASRMLSLDRAVDTLGLIRDVIVPPVEHLRWRWPSERTTLAAWMKHVGQVVRKVGGGWGRSGKDGGEGRD